MKALLNSVPDFYLSFIQWTYQVPLLSREREVELVQLMQAGGRAGERARHELVEAHMKLVVSVARKSFKGGVPLEDLIQEGNIGLLQAADKFDLAKGVRFTTYAWWWIKQAIRMYVQENASLIRLSPNRHRDVAKLKMAMDRVAARGVDPTDSAVAAEMGISLKEVRALAEDLLSVFSLHVPATDESETPIGDLLADENAVSAEDRILENDSAEHLHAALAKLAPRERDIVCKRRGIGHDEHTLEDLAQEHSVTRERIRQIQAKAEKKLAKLLSGKVA